MNVLGGNKNVDTRNIRSRDLALQLLHGSIQKFVSDIDIVRDKIVPRLCANVTSTIQPIINRVMDIFSTLIKRQKHNVIVFDSF